MRSLTVTVEIERTTAPGTLRADLRGVPARQPVELPPGIYLVRFDLADDGSRVRGEIRLHPGGPTIAFTSGRRLAALLAAILEDGPAGDVSGPPG